MDLHHAGVVRRVARWSLCGWRGGDTAGRGCCPRRGGTISPLSTPALEIFLSRCKTQKESKGKRKALILPTSFPGATAERGRGRRLLLSPGGGFLLRALRLRFGHAAPCPRHCGIVPSCPRAGTVPAGRLSSFIASEAAGGCGLPPRDPCGAGDRWWHGGDTPDCAIGTLPGREQGADTGGTERGSVQAQAGQGGK